MPTRIFFCLLIFLSHAVIGQETINIDYYDNMEFTEADSIRGALRLERNCFDVKHYDLKIDLDINNKSISGQNDMRFQYLENSKSLQIDLFENMEVEEISIDGESCSYFRKYDAVFVILPELKIGNDYTMKIKFSGQPTIAKSPPWDGGFVWSQDKNKNPWIGVACEGTGASLWWPNKDHLSDEPDSMKIAITVPEELMAVSNGNLINTTTLDGRSTYEWNVSYPINNYNVSINVGDYQHFSDVYTSPTKGDLACDYYVLSYNLKKAKEHFKQVDGVLESFEHYFGPYPFWKDGFALIETPYLGMEHQSGIAYGNQYKRGYLGSMIPKDMNWDYIIVHETGHEYWGNSISVKDHADMWIHEGFTTYMEALYVEYHYGREAVNRYLVMQRRFLQNMQPILGPKNVNFEEFGGSDHYYKGSYLLHTLRSVMNDDEAWFDLLRAVYDEYKLSVVETKDIIQFINDYCNEDYTKFFQQYLGHGPLPELEYQLLPKGKNLCVRYKWNSPVENFSMPIEIGKLDETMRLNCTTEWQETKFKKMEPEEFWINQHDYLINTTITVME